MTEEAPQGEVPAPDASVTEVTAESSPATEVQAETAADTGVSEPVKNEVQKRIDKLTWEKSERDREIAYWRNLALQRQEAERKPEPVKEEPKVPTLAQFEYDEAKYQAAVMEYTRSEAARAARSEIESDRQREQAEGRVKSFRTREAEYAAKTPDYREMVYGSGFMSIPLSTEVAALIAESPDGPAIAYHLAQNLDVASEIARLSPLAAAREIGRIESKLNQPKPAPVSKAPAPPPKIEESPEVVTKVKVDEPDSDKLSDAEWMRRRNLQQKRKGA